MPRIFYTERDIEDLAARGVTEIEVNDNVYLTDLAREKMDKLGIKRKVTSPPPQLSSVLASPDVATLHATPAASATGGALSPDEKQQVIEKVKSGVLARLGPGVDAAIVDQIVRRVVNRL